jgi:hypothetical protein
MAMRRKRDLAKERFWRQAIRRRQASGSSVREFCLRERLSQASFHNWRREIARRDAEVHTLAVARKTPRRAKSTSRADKRTPSASPFVPVVVDAAPSASVEIVLADDTLVRVPPGCDHQTLELVLAALQRASVRGGRASADEASGAPPC